MLHRVGYLGDTSAEVHVRRASVLGLRQMRALQRDSTLKRIEHHPSADSEEFAHINRRAIEPSVLGPKDAFVAEDAQVMIVRRDKAAREARDDAAGKTNASDGKVSPHLMRRDFAALVWDLHGGKRRYVGGRAEKSRQPSQAVASMFERAADLKFILVWPGSAGVADPFTVGHEMNQAVVHFGVYHANFTDGFVADGLP